jgi:hypothetical protein
MYRRSFVASHFQDQVFSDWVFVSFIQANPGAIGAVKKN